VETSQAAEREFEFRQDFWECARWKPGSGPCWIDSNGDRDARQRRGEVDDPGASSSYGDRRVENRHASNDQHHPHSIRAGVASFLASCELRGQGVELAPEQRRPEFLVGAQAPVPSRS